MTTIREWSVISEESNTIVIFPKGRRGSPAQPLEDIQLNVSTLRMARIDEASDALLQVLFDDMSLLGYVLEPDCGYDKHIALIAESVKSLLSFYHAIEHPFQEIANREFVEAGENIVRMRSLAEIAEFDSHVKVTDAVGNTSA